MRRFLFCCVFCVALQAISQESSSPGPATGQAPAPAPAQENSASSGDVSSQLAKAEASIVAKDWKAAEPVLDAWLAAHPSDARALFDAGYVADAQGRDEDAAGLYRKAVAANPESFEAHISLGLLLARTNHEGEARTELEAATKLDAGASGPAAKARAWRALARIDSTGSGADHQGAPDLAAASTDLLEALKLSPETVDDTLLAATLADRSGQAKEAETAYRRVLKQEPDSKEAIAGLAHLLIAGKQYDEAETLLRPALAKSPEDPTLTAQLAAVLVAQDKAEALPLLEQLHAKQPEDAAVTKMLAEVMTDAGEYESSDKLYAALLQANPKDAELLAGHGQNLIRLRRYPEALKAFEDATEVDEANGEAWNGLAFAAFQTHQPALTLHALTMRSKYLPETATVYFLWATAYDTLHSNRQAVAYYHKFLDSAQGKFPDQEWQAHQRLNLLEKMPR